MWLITYQLYRDMRCAGNAQTQLSPVDPVEFQRLHQIDEYEGIRCAILFAYEVNNV